MHINPMRAKPVYMDKIWGGQGIRALFPNRLLPTQRIGESWECSTHLDGLSEVTDSGGRTMQLRDWIAKDPESILGQNAVARFGRDCPVLIKILSAGENLSVQVHPDDAYAARFGQSGKTEAWLVLYAQPGARLQYGLMPGVTRQLFEMAVKDHTIEHILSWMEVVPGDVLYVPAGMVHAVGAGLVLYEVQQNSNTTYRVYDWNRTDDQGKPRPLHIAETLAVTDFDSPAPVKVQPRIIREPGAVIRHYISCPYFELDMIILSGAWRIIPGTFQSYTLLEGTISIEGEDTTVIEEGETFFLPAALPAVRLIPKNDHAKLIRSQIPMT